MNSLLSVAAAFTPPLPLPSLDSNPNGFPCPGPPSPVPRYRHFDTDSDDELEDDQEANGDPNSPWKGESQRYVYTVEAVPDNMSIVEWWGVRVFIAW
jgi:hypothetical protein